MLDQQLYACVGENLDALATLDLRGNGMLRALYRVARERQGAPLTLSAARALRDRVGAGDRVLILTGFLAPKPHPETDGPIGSAVLAAALERGCGAVPVFVCEEEAVAVVRAGLRGAALNPAPSLAEAEAVPHGAAVLPFPTEPGAASALAGAIAPAACVAVERPGANPQGQYHFAMGKNVTADIAPIDGLYRDVAAGGALTVGVGDFGNELGMGAIADAVRAMTPAGADCGCGCGGGTACETPADVTVAASVSDWGAYAIAACLSHLCRDGRVLIDPASYRRILDGVVGAGAIDGPTGYALPSIDAVDDSFNAALLEVMRRAALPKAGD